MSESKKQVTTVAEKKFKVVYVENFMFVDQVRVGHLDSYRDMTYVNVCLYPKNTQDEWNFKREPVARYKYAQHKSRAKHLLKWLLERFTPEELAECLSFSKPVQVSPLEWAEARGYVMPQPKLKNRRAV